MVIFNNYMHYSQVIEINHIMLNFTVFEGEKIISFGRDYQVIIFFQCMCEKPLAFFFLFLKYLAIPGDGT